jgi:hypothetical protein
MARCAEALIQDPLSRMRIGAAARAELLELWTWSNQVDAIERELLLIQP